MDTSNIKFQVLKPIFAMIIILFILSCENMIGIKERPAQEAIFPNISDSITRSPQVDISSNEYLNENPNQTETLQIVPTAKIELNPTDSLMIECSTCNDIRMASLSENNDLNHPLPLIGSWNAATWWNYDTDQTGNDPLWQFEMINDGYHLLPWFNIPEPDMDCVENQDCYYQDYFEIPIKKAAQLNLPISFIGTQWEHYLYDDPVYFELPLNENPNVILMDGSIQKKISPFGPVNHWYSVGYRWGSSSLMQQVISWYPSPPLIIFISNNEADKLGWMDAETDQHYINLYGSGRDDAFKRKVFAEAWEERYKALMSGFRDGLDNIIWETRSKFIGYQAFGPGWFGSWDGWEEYSLYVPNHIDPSPLFWEGGSPSIYIWAEHGERDNTVIGPLFQAMNFVFIQDEFYKENPSYWFEISSWEGNKNSREIYEQLGQGFNPQRYEGFIQYGMWLTRPRIIREYQDWDSSRSETFPWFIPIINSVERIYSNPILQSFWRQSTLVANTAQQHPYQSNIPLEYQTINRMFLLKTNLDPLKPWSLETEFPIMSLARLKIQNCNRQWLLYAYAPLGSQNEVEIYIPDYKTVIVDVALEGSFYIIDEATQDIIPISDNINY